MGPSFGDYPPYFWSRSTHTDKCLFVSDVVLRRGQSDTEVEAEFGGSPLQVRRCLDSALTYVDAYHPMYDYRIWHLPQERMTTLSLLLANREIHSELHHFARRAVDPTTPSWPSG